MPDVSVLDAIPYIAGEDAAALKLARTKKMAEFGLDELKRLAARAKLPEKMVVDAARETVQRFREVWAQEKANLPQAAKVTASIDAHAPTVLLYRELA